MKLKHSKLLTENKHFQSKDIKTYTNIIGIS